MVPSYTPYNSASVATPKVFEDRNFERSFQLLSWDTSLRKADRHSIFYLEKSYTAVHFTSTGDVLHKKRLSNATLIYVVTGL